MPETPFGKVKPHPYKARDPADAPTRTIKHSAIDYVELAVTSNYTFLTGASHPEELVEQAATLGHRAASIADTNTLAGIVRAHVAARDRGVAMAVGCRLRVEWATQQRDEETKRQRDVVKTEKAGAPATSSLRLSVSPFPNIIVYPTTRNAYASLCRLLTLGKRRAPKGECSLTLDDVCEYSEGLLAIVVPPTYLDDAFTNVLHRLCDVFDDDRLSLAAAYLYCGNDEERLAQLAALAQQTRVPMVATNDVHYHVPQRRVLQDIVTCIRHGRTIEDAGMRLEANAERYLKGPDEMARLFAAYPDAIARTVEMAERTCAFSLDELKYDYPVEPCPEGLTPIEYLRERTIAGAQWRYSEGVPEKVKGLIENELQLIEELHYEAYFLTCYDIVTFARGRGILCQGRGGAANSAVCYCLGITEVDPSEFQLLFARFISRSRNEPPDIDIDFEHERREEVIQYLYEKYGRDRAALTAVVITYRRRSAVREVGKVMGLSLDGVDVLAKNMDMWREGPNDKRVREVGLNPSDPIIRQVIERTNEIVGFPRHLSQHVGGFVITRTKLCDLVPIENAAMEDRTVIEWDKDDIDAMGMLKVDCLGLGMLTCVRKALEMVVAKERRRDRETKRQSMEDGDGECKDLSGSCGLAARNGACQEGVYRNEGNAKRGEIGPDDADEAGSGFSTVQHRRGVWKGKPSGPVAVSANCPWVTERVVDSAGACDRTGLHSEAGRFGNADRRSRSRVTGIDQKHGANEPALAHSVSSSLDLFVSAMAHYRRLAANPTDPSTYTMIQRADTVGVFQIESRAQMSMLPLLKPREFYDLVIEVAIVRPGPIQGGMVHPYLRRRQGLEPVVYPSPDVEHVLGRTLGVPLFQEQAMQLAIVAAGFTPDEADGLRRAMASWRRKGDKMVMFGKRLIAGMLERGYPLDFAERCFAQIKGFSEYGFPESHAASFALIVYVSCYLKRHHPAAFAAALINSQPMGFYAPAQIIRDAREHGVEVRAIDVNSSGWDCVLEERDEEIERRRDEGEDQDAHPERWGVGGPALRLGMRLVKGLPEAQAQRVVDTVARVGPFRTVESLWRASGVTTRALRCLARADAFRSMGLDRQGALWQIRPLRDAPMPLFEHTDGTDDTGLDALPKIPLGRQVLQDYEASSLSLKAHPMSFVRRRLEEMNVTRCTDLRSEKQSPTGRRVSIAGIALTRQRPSTASGVVFITLEDETGIANLIVWRDTFERYRKIARLATVILAHGRIERQGEVVHIHVEKLEALDHWMPALASRSRDFH